MISSVKIHRLCKDYEGWRPAPAGYDHRPLIKQEQCQIIDSQIKDAVSKGAVLLTGGTMKGTIISLPYYQM